MFPAVVTQLGECQTEDLEVAGSSPAHRTIKTDLLGRHVGLSKVVQVLSQPDP